MAKKKYIYLPDGKIPVGDANPPKGRTDIDTLIKLLKSVSNEK